MEAFTRLTDPVEQNAHLASIVESSDDAILSKDTQAIITSWNPGAERLYGYSAAEAIGRSVAILIPDARSGEERVILDRILAGERVDHYETERCTKDGRMVTVSLSVGPIKDAEGEIVGASVIARDITAAHRTRMIAGRLHEVTAALSQAVSSDEAIRVLLHHSVAALEADAGTVGFLDEHGDHIELSGTEGHSEVVAKEWSRFPLDADVPMSIAIRTNEPVWVTSRADLAARFPVFDSSEVTFGSFAVIPLAVEGRAAGAVSLSFREERELDQEERAFLSAVAHGAAQALERARLYEAERRGAERLAFLAQASELLGSSLDVESTLRSVADLAVHRVADWCSIDLLEDDGSLRGVAVAHIDPERVAMATELRERYPADPAAETGVPQVIRTGRSELYPEIPDEMLAAAAQDEEHLRLMRDLGLVSVIVAPLTVRERTFGAITFISSDPGRRYGRADLELAEDLARRAALALDNAMLFRREHEAAVTLQRSLLPRSLPEVHGIELAARYDPAAPGLEVGGDWYEVIPHGDIVALTIGDVAGRGIRAAAVMGRVRAALRAYVLDGHDPKQAITRLDRAIQRSDQVEMTTIFHMHLDRSTGRAEYVRAGHPPALARLPDGAVHELNGTGCAPLGVFEDLRCDSKEAELPPGSLVVLYTDGLIERRTEDLNVGLTRLKEVLAEAPPGAQECLDWITEAFSTEAILDDVAILVAAIS